MRTLLASAVLVVGCAGQSAVSPPPSAIVSAPVQAPTPLATSSPSASPRGFVAGSSTQWPAIDLYTVDTDGTAHRFDGRGDVTLGMVCSAPLRTAAGANGTAPLAWCQSGRDAQDVYRLLPRIERVASGALLSWPADISPDGHQAVAFQFADCEPSAPVCRTRAVLIDLLGGTQREILPGNYYLGATLGWTALGLTYFQPECAEAGCPGPDRSGTWVWNGSRFERRTELRFVARNGQWELYEKLRSFSDTSAPRQVILRGPGGDAVVVAGVGERALAVDAAGGVLVWHSPDGQDGYLMRYDRNVAPTRLGDVSGSVVGVIEASLVATFDYNPFHSQKVRLYDLAHGLVFQAFGTGALGVAMVAR